MDNCHFIDVMPDPQWVLRDPVGYRQQLRFRMVGVQEGIVFNCVRLDEEKHAIDEPEPSQDKMPPILPPQVVNDRPLDVQVKKRAEGEIQRLAEIGNGKEFYDIPGCVEQHLQNNKCHDQEKKTLEKVGRVLACAPDEEPRKQETLADTQENEDVGESYMEIRRISHSINIQKMQLTRLTRRINCSKGASVLPGFSHPNIPA